MLAQQAERLGPPVTLLDEAIFKLHQVLDMDVVENPTFVAAIRSEIRALRMQLDATMGNDAVDGKWLAD